MFTNMYCLCYDCIHTIRRKETDNFMLASKNMLQSLSEEHSENYKDSNNDCDFGKVLEFCASGENDKCDRAILCSDGEKRVLSFEL